MAKGRRRTTVAAERARIQTRNAVIKLVGVAAAVLAVGVIYYVVASARRDLDPQTLCPAEPDSVTVLLVDVTDPMNLAQRQDFNNQLERLKVSIPRYGKFVVTRVDAASENLLTPVVARCNPGSAADINPLTGDPATVQRQWEKGFDEPLESAFALVASGAGAERSPILESIQSVVLTEFGPMVWEGKPKHLIVVSDLLQNTPDVSFYGGVPSAEAFIASPGFRRVRSDLRGVTVELWMLERSDTDTTQPQALTDLWRRLIRAQGGTMDEVYEVSG